MQVITFHNSETSAWSCIVYPADCTLASATGEQIHLVGHGLGNIENAVYDVLQKLYTLIDRRFLPGSQTVAPVLQNRQAPCECLQKIASVVVVQHGGEGDGGSSSSASDHRSESNVVGMAVVESIQPIVALDILPVYEKIQSTRKGLERRNQVRFTEPEAVHDGPDVIPAVYRPTYERYQSGMPQFDWERPAESSRVISGSPSGSESSAGDLSPLKNDPPAPPPDSEDPYVFRNVGSRYSETSHVYRAGSPDSEIHGVQRSVESRAVPAGLPGRGVRARVREGFRRM